MVRVRVRSIVTPIWVRVRVKVYVLIFERVNRERDIIYIHILKG